MATNNGNNPDNPRSAQDAANIHRVALGLDKPDTRGAIVIRFPVKGESDAQIVGRLDLQEVLGALALVSADAVVVFRQQAQRDRERPRIVAPRPGQGFRP